MFAARTVTTKARFRTLEFKNTTPTPCMLMCERPKVIRAIMLEDCPHLLHGLWTHMDDGHTHTVCMLMCDRPIVSPPALLQSPAPLGRTRVRLFGEGRDMTSFSILNVDLRALKTLRTAVRCTPHGAKQSEELDSGALRMMV